MALFTGHHGQTHGPIGLIDVALAVDGNEPIRILTPGVPVIAEKIEDSRRGWYSDLMKLLTKGHHDVVLSDEQSDRLANWIDANGVYYDRYETYTNNRHIFSEQTIQVMSAVHQRRCAGCHEVDDRKQHAWWTSLNRHDAAKSRSLRAPLAKTAGGWQRCKGIIFADTNDPDYQRLLKALTDLQTTMRAQPRADLRSLHTALIENGPFSVERNQRPVVTQGFIDH